MSLAIILLLMISFVAFLAYLKLPPKYGDKKLISIFNKMVLGVVAVICLFVYLNGRINFPFSPMMKEVMAVLAAVGVEIISLVIFFLLRNFWLFKRPKNHSTW